MTPVWVGEIVGCRLYAVALSASSTKSMADPKMKNLLLDLD